jgi:hypothetical protein
MLKKNFLPRRMPPYATVLETYTTYSMPNVPLAYVSELRRMSDIFHTLVRITIRNSVTGPLATPATMAWHWLGTLDSPQPEAR